MLLVLQHCGSVTKLKNAKQKEKESIKAIRPPEIDNIVACKLFPTLRMYFLVDSATCKNRCSGIFMQLPEIDAAVSSEHQLPSGVSCAETLLDTHDSAPYCLCVLVNARVYKCLQTVLNGS